ncbi:MAG: hypothetical protein J7L78_00085, partial [Dehalococcoidales bacterium]|nr:hypothetical protein [Dehalococcoidales bacterium]
VTNPSPSIPLPFIKGRGKEFSKGALPLSIPLINNLLLIDYSTIRQYTFHILHGQTRVTGQYAGTVVKHSAEDKSRLQKNLSTKEE